ncbi:zinc-dependent alcohol dehydrogenase family protein [Shinella sp. CPCC 101442]|uniref:zinc-dependent alcohol dehydrogenase family protein n=1 Tax=Shinella sp. CPCC 101442 TaxID=2932265 RepID=UPI002152DAA3|nr:zinc-dependent alcohol dehydrogenase family protein [Shinella sp. CPCC 101442]MCR6499169.1 zinc-dependent alcohol dehydrogenase family protein [Shinella sp. CPCC 101442]
MLRAVVRAFGDPRQVIGLEETERGTPGSGEVEIRIRRAAVNPSDLIPVTGAYRSRTALPFVPGFEGVGEIVRLGAGVSGLAIGQRVLPIGASGLWQGHLIRPAEWCFAVPDDLADDQAAMAYVNPLTAFRLVDAVSTHFRGTTGRRIGVTAAASAIGKMLLVLLAEAGFQPVALVRSAATATRLAESFSGEIVTASTPALDAVLDAVGGEAGNALFRNIRPGGAFIQYGALSGAQLDPALVTARREEVAFSFLWLRNWVHSAPRATIAAEFDRSFTGIRAGYLASAIDTVFALSELPAALARQDDPSRTGKLLIAP